MDNKEILLFEKIKTKYIRKTIFSYIKLPTLLKLLIPYKRLRNLLEITDFHYQYYYVLLVFKTINIETINDILFSDYINILPEDSKYKIIIKLINKRKLFINKPIELNISAPLLDAIVQDKNYQNYFDCKIKNKIDFKLEEKKKENKNIDY